MMEETTDLVPAGAPGPLAVSRRWPRGGLWEDALLGVRLGAGVGVVVLLWVAFDLHLAGSLVAVKAARKALLAAGLGGLGLWLRGKIQSMTVIDDATREIHDAVRIGGTLYIQGSVPFDQVVAVRQSRREARAGTRDQESIEEGRLELVLRGGERRVLTDWVSDAEASGGRDWRQMEDRLTALLDLTDAPLDLRDQSSAGREDWARFATWFAAAVAVGGVLAAVG